MDSICAKYESHPSITAIKEASLTHVFNFEYVNESEIGKIISKLNTKKAAGCDYISPKILKSSVHVICPVITKIINHCITQSVFPCELKVAEVSSILKNNDKLDK